MRGSPGKVTSSWQHYKDDNWKPSFLTTCVPTLVSHMYALGFSQRTLGQLDESGMYGGIVFPESHCIAPSAPSPWSDHASSCPPSCREGREKCNSQTKKMKHIQRGSLVPHRSLLILTCHCADDHFPGWSMHVSKPSVLFLHHPFLSPRTCHVVRIPVL